MQRSSVIPESHDRKTPLDAPPTDGTLVAAAELASLLTRIPDWKQRKIDQERGISDDAKKLMTALSEEPQILCVRKIESRLHRQVPQSLNEICATATSFAREHLALPPTSTQAQGIFPAFVKFSHIGDWWVVAIWRDGRYAIAPKFRNLDSDLRKELETLAESVSTQKEEDGTALRSLENELRPAKLAPRKAPSPGRSSQAALEFKSKVHTDNINALALRAEGEFLTASADGTAECWNLKSRSRKFVMGGHNGPINHVALTLDSRRILTASADSTVRVWDCNNGKELAVLKPYHDGPVNYVIPTYSNGAISASADGKLRLWDLDTYKCVREFDGRGGPVNHVQLCCDGRAVSGSADGTLRIWELDREKKPCELRGHTSPINHVGVTLTELAISASADKTLRIWDIHAEKCLYTLEGHTAPVNRVALTSDGHFAISASNDKMLRVWGVEDGKFIGALNGHTRKVNDVVTTHGGLCISASSDCTLKVWNLKSLTCLSTLKAHPLVVSRVVVASDGQLAVSGSQEGTICGWNLSAAIARKNSSPG